MASINRIMLVRVLLLLFAAVASLPAQTPSPPPSLAAANYDLRWGVKIPLRDKVELNATLYLPRVAPATKTPAVFTLTPYVSDTYHDRGAYFATHGYVFATVDVRGRGNSGGNFEPFANDARDGHDIVEWLAQQPFCDGKVSMWGGSYAGFDQWSTAKEFPPHLAAIVPVASAHPPLDFPYSNNIGQRYATQWLTYTSGKAGQFRIFGDSKMWRAKFLEAHKQHIPFNALDIFVGNPSPHFQRFVKNAGPNEYWDAMVPSTEQYRKLNMPILSLTGQYDGDEPGALTFYRNHLANASPEARAKHFLIIGPWDHAGTRTPTDEVGGVKFGPAALLDLNDLHRQWYDWTLKGGTKPEFLKDMVAYYVIPAGNSGANGEWRCAPSLEALSANAKTFYLDSPEESANGVLHSGTLSESLPEDSASASGSVESANEHGNGADNYIYDPLDMRRAEFVDADDSKEKTANLDQTYALSIAGDGLVYHTEPLPAETPLIGCPRATLWVSMDVPDTDMTVDLYEIQPDGTSIALWSDIRRLRYRESLRQEKLVRPGEIVECKFDPGLFVARRLMKGSRLRLVVSSPNSIAWEKNYNSGGVVANEQTKDARTAHVRVHHNVAVASSIELPLR